MYIWNREKAVSGYAFLGPKPLKFMSALPLRLLVKISEERIQSYS